MSSRSAKRKRWSLIKDRVVHHLQILNVTSEDFNNDLAEANEFFGEMFKTMEVRQSDLFARVVGLEEKYGEVIDILMDGKKSTNVESSEQKMELPTGYTTNMRKFLTDSSTSLSSHAKDFKEKMDEMINTFQRFGDAWKEKISNLTMQADIMVENRGKISVILNDFSRNI